VITMAVQNENAFHIGAGVCVQFELMSRVIRFISEPPVDYKAVGTAV
jgi:hypothetical protein